MSRLKSLASDTLVYGISTIAGRFLNFLLTPLYTNYLMKAELGGITYIFTLLAFLNIIYSFGFESSFFRFYSKDDSEQTNKVFTCSAIVILIISGTSSIIIFFLSGSIADSVSELRGAEGLIRLAAAIPFLDAMMLIPYAYLRMKRKSLRFASTKFLLILLTISLNVAFIVGYRYGAKGVLISQLIASAIGAACFLPMIISKLNFRFDRKLFWEMFRFGIPTLPANLAAIILQVADRPILTALTNLESVAMYQVNYRLGIPMMLIVSVFEYAWKPFYLSHYEEQDAKHIFSRVLTYFTILCSLVFLGTVFFMEYIIRLPFIGGRFINPQYWSGMGIIPIVLAGYYFNGIFTNFAAGFYITKNTKYLSISVGIAALTNVALNFILIPFFDIKGAAWATFGAYLISAAVLFLYLNKIYPLNYQWKRIAIIILLTAVLYSIGLILSPNFDLSMNFVLRCGLLMAGAALLWGFNFFSKSEVSGLKQMMKFRS